MTPSTGEIRAFAGSYAPLGWALCNGQQLPVSGNQLLYALIGNTYGGNSTNFALPDLRGRLILNQGTGPGRTNRALAQAGGEETVALTPAQMSVHTHTAMASTANATSAIPTNNYLAAIVDTTTAAATLQFYIPNNLTPPAVVQPLQAATVTTVGGSQPHENRMPYQVINYIICTAGIYPTP